MIHLGASRSNGRYGRSNSLTHIGNARSRWRVRHRLTVQHFSGRSWRRSTSAACHAAAVGRGPSRQQHATWRQSPAGWRVRLPRRQARSHRICPAGTSGSPYCLPDVPRQRVLRCFEGALCGLYRRIIILDLGHLGLLSHLKRAEVPASS